MIRLADLQPHPEVQRDRFNLAWARTIRDTFDPDAFGELVVVVVDGHFYVVDGQHRLWAAKEYLGLDQRVPCRVYDVPLRRQAELFLQVNTGKAVHALTKFRVGVLAERIVPVTVQRILERHGLRAGITVGSVRAVVACQRVITRHNAETLDRVLGILRAAWGPGSESYDGILIRGLAYLLAQSNGAVNDRDLAQKLERAGTPGGLLGKARARADATETSVDRAMADVVRTLYDKGRRTRKLTTGA